MKISKINFNSNLISAETNVLLGNAIEKFNAKNERFSSTLAKTHSRFQRKQNVIIDMPENFKDFASFSTGIKSSLKLETPVDAGVKIRFNNNSGYKGKYASIEKIEAEKNGNVTTKFDIAEDWLEITSSDKSKNIVYTTSQMPAYQDKIFGNADIKKYNNPEVSAQIQKIDSEIAQYLRQILNPRREFFAKILNIFKANSEETVGIKKYSSF